MADRSYSEIKQLLREEFGDTLTGSRDDGLNRMVAALARRGTYDRASAEALLAELVEQDQLRYVGAADAGAEADTGLASVLSPDIGADTTLTGGGEAAQGGGAAGRAGTTGYWDLS